MISRERDLDVEKLRAGCAGAKPEGYVPPCSYSYNAFGLDEALCASNPPDFFFGGATRHEWVLPAATLCVWPYEAMYGEEVKASGFLDNNRRRELTLQFFQPIEKDCGKNLVFYYANYSNPLSEEEPRRRGPRRCSVESHERAGNARNATHLQGAGIGPPGSGEKRCRMRRIRVAGIQAPEDSGAVQKIVHQRIDRHHTAADL